MNSGEEKSFQARPNLLWYDSITSTLTIGGQITILVTSIGCLVIVNTYLKMLHETIKKLLNIVLFHNILTSSTVTSLMTYMMTSHSQDFMMCSIWLVTGANVFVTRFGIALMSFLRYHISWKISKCESTKNVSKLMIIIMVVYLVFEYFVLGPFSFFVTIFFDIPSAALSCAGKNTQGLPILPMFHVTKTLIIIIFGITYDIFIMKFLRKRNAQREPGQSKLVMWKSGDQDHDLLVPVSATVTSVIAGISSLGMAYMLVKGYVENDEESWKTMAFSASVMNNIDMIVMIGLTIRAAKLRNQKPNIPRRPIYYDKKVESSEGQVNVIQFLTKEHERLSKPTTFDYQDEQQRTPKQQIESYPSTSSNNIRLIEVKPNLMHHDECYM